MNIEQIKQLATDVNNVAVTSFESGKEHAERPLLAKIERLEAKIERIKHQYSEDVCAISRVYYPKPICEKQPPEITNLLNACLSCPMRETCGILFVDKPIRQAGRKVGDYE